MRLTELVGKRVHVITANTRYQFDIFAIGDIHGESFPVEGRHATKYLDGRYSDIEIRGTKTSRYPWNALGPQFAREGQLFEGGFLSYRYPGHLDYITTSMIREIKVEPLPENPLCETFSTL